MVVFYLAFCVLSVMKVEFESESESSPKLILKINIFFILRMRWLLLVLVMVLLQGGGYCCSDEEAKFELEQMMKVSIFY